MGLRFSLSTANSAHEGADPEAEITQMLDRRGPGSGPGARNRVVNRQQRARKCGPGGGIRAYACNVAVDIIVVGQIAPARVPREP